MERYTLDFEEICSCMRTSTVLKITSTLTTSYQKIIEARYGDIIYTQKPGMTKQKIFTSLTKTKQYVNYGITILNNYQL